MRGARCRSRKGETVASADSAVVCERKGHKGVVGEVTRLLSGCREVGVDVRPVPKGHLGAQRKFTRPAELSPLLRRKFANTNSNQLRK